METIRNVTIVLIYFGLLAVIIKQQIDYYKREEDFRKQLLETEIKFKKIINELKMKK